MTCGHCFAVFNATYKQHYSATASNRSSFCSSICREANLRAKFSTPVPMRGPCVGCGDSFQSRREAKFCGVKCYTGSKQFTEMLAESRAKAMGPVSIARRAEQARRGQGKPCLECGVNVYAKKSERSKKYCSTTCYRSYMAKRFDRHIANPESLSLPQGYDAFLDRQELPCLVADCGWSGRHLSLHMNYAHGIKADEIKRAAGFNKSTGLVCKPLAQALQGRDRIGVAADMFLRQMGAEHLGAVGRVMGYKSLEGAEHRAKARALSSGGPLRACIGCRSDFIQSTVYGQAKYCSIPCRTRHYRTKVKPLRAVTETASATTSPPRAESA